MELLKNYLSTHKFKSPNDKHKLIQSIAIFVLERIPKHLPRRYKLFDISFDNKIREVLESRGQ